MPLLDSDDFAEVTCRIGSLEMIVPTLKRSYTVTCRIGSLEILA